MKRLLLPLLAAIALPTAGNAESIDPETVKACIKAADFKSCVLEKWTDERQARYKMDFDKYNKIINEESKNLGKVK
tara:strand:- start:326 stop:553 length:228 start_codon:yes stop_codon:yes gene_type:complete